MFSKFCEGKVPRLAPIQYGFNNVRRQECTRENPSDVPFRQTSLASKGPQPRRLTVPDFLIPAMSARDGFQQRGVCSRWHQVRFGKYHQVDFTTTTFQLGV